MRGLSLLHPEVQTKALMLQELAQERFDIRIIFTDTLRTSAEQTALYAQGRQILSEVNRLRSLAGMGPIADRQNRIITKATLGSSWHEYGLAFDIAITDPDGKRIIWDSSSDWNGDGQDDWAQVGSLADECGLEWGGNFTSIYDAPHYQDRRGMTIAQMKQQFTPGETANVN